MYGAHLLLAVACIANTVPFGTMQPLPAEATDTYNCIQTACSFGFCDPESVCIANGTNGCSKTATSSGLFFEQGCSNTPCVPVYASYYGGVVTTDCCFSEKCNTGTMTSTLDNPGIDECYSVVCDDDRHCVSQVVAKGDARLCRMPEGGGCKFIYTAGEFNAGIAECYADDASCTNGAMYDLNIPSGSVQQCCNQNTCNDGSIEKIPDTDNCYSLTCTGGEGCIEAAIKNDIFLYCAQKGFGCVTEEMLGTYTSGCSSKPCEGSNEECCFGDLCNSPAGVISIFSTTMATGSTDSKNYYDSNDVFYEYWTERFDPSTRTETPVISGIGSTDSNDVFYGSWTDSTNVYYDSWTERFDPSTRTKTPVISGTGGTDSTDVFYWTDIAFPSTRTKTPVIAGTGSTDSTDVFYWTDIIFPSTRTKTPVTSGTGGTDSTDVFYWTDIIFPSTRTKTPVISGTGGTDSTDVFYWTDINFPSTRTKTPVISGTGSTDSTQLTSSTETSIISGGSTEKSSGTSSSNTAGTSAAETTGSSTSKMIKTSTPKVTSKSEVTTPKSVKSSTRISDINSPSKDTDTSVVSGASKPRSFTSFTSLFLISFLTSLLLSTEVEM